MAPTKTEEPAQDGGVGTKHKADDSAPPAADDDGGGLPGFGNANKKARTDGGGDGDGATTCACIPGPGSIWKFDDGTEEEIVDILQEPRHHLDFTNNYARSFSIKFPPKDVTLAHGHEYDTIVILLMKGGIRFINHVMGLPPQEGTLAFKDVRFAPYTANPCVHKITNLSNEDMYCINVEIMKKAPIAKSDALEAPMHSVVMEREGACRVYMLKLKKGEKADVCYDFFYTHVVVSDKGKVEVTARGSSGKEATWVEESVMGDIGWRGPSPDLSIKNTGEGVYEAYICEWC